MNIHITAEEAEKRNKRHEVLVRWEAIKAKVIRVLMDEEDINEDEEIHWKQACAYETIFG